MDVSKLNDLNTGDIIQFVSKDETYNNKIAIFLSEVNKNYLFEILENNLQIDFKNFTENDYGINDLTIIKKQESEKVREIIDNSIEYEDFKDTFEVTRELSIWEREWSREELKNSMIDTLYKEVKNTNKYDYINKKVETILDIIYKNSYTQSSNLNQFINKPLIEKFNKGDYSYIINPIIADKKKIYTKNSNLLSPDEDQLTYDNINFTSIDNEVSGIIKLSEMYSKNEIDRDDFENKLLNKFTIEEGDETVQFYNVNRPYINETKINNDYYKTASFDSSMNIYRFVENSLVINGTTDKIKKNDLLEKRIIEPNYYRLYDRLTNRIIGEKSSKYSVIKSCSNTGMGNDTFYSGAQNKKEHKTNDFNKSIIHPPKKNLYIKGEELKIIGILIKSINNYKPPFLSNNYTSDEKKNEDLGYYILQSFEKINNYGYNLMDHIKINSNNIRLPYKNLLHKSNLNIINNINLVNPSSINFNKNNVIYFNKDNPNSKEIANINSYLDNVIPNLVNLYRFVEKHSLNKCNSFTDIDKIISKYGLSIDSTHFNIIKNIDLKNLFLKNIDKHLDYNEYTYLKYLESTENHKKFNSINKIIKDTISKLDKDLAHNYQSDDAELYIVNLRHSVSEMLFNILNHHYDLSDIKLYTINYLHINIDLGHEMSYESKLKAYIDSILTTILRKESLGVFNNNFYKNLNKYVEQDILKLYNFKTIDEKNIDSNQNTNNIINSINLSFDNGKLLHASILMYYLDKQIKTVNIELEQYAKKNYLKIIGKDEWDILQDYQRQEYIPNLTDMEYNYNQKLEVLNNQKKIYNYYLSKCESYEIVKIYKTIEQLKEDNIKSLDSSKNIYYDKMFDTTENDCNVAKKIIDDYNTANQTGFANVTDAIKSLVYEKLKNIYIFDSETKLEKKIDNINLNLDNEDKRQIISDNEHALLHNQKERILYKRIKNLWIPLSKEELINNRCVLEKKDTLSNILDIDFINLIQSNSNDSQYESENSGKILSNDEKKCITIDDLKQNKCIPKKIVEYILDYRQEYNEYLKLKQLFKNRTSLNLELESYSTLIRITKEQLLKSKYKKQKLIDNVNIIPQKDKKSSIPQNLLDKFKNAHNISDPDIKLSTLREIIDEYGVFEKPILDVPNLGYEPESPKEYGTIGAPKEYGTIGYSYGQSVNYGQTYGESSVAYGGADPKEIEESSVKKPRPPPLDLTNNPETPGLTTTSPDYVPTSPDYHPSSYQPISPNYMPGQYTGNYGYNIYDTESPDYGPPSSPFSQEDNNIYWNYPETSEVMCCKHYLDLTDLAWMENNIRIEKLELLKQKWAKSNTIEGNMIVCDHCGEKLVNIDYSDFEGFSGDNKPVKFREMVIDDYGETLYTKEETSFKKILDLYTSNIGINLNEIDTEFIIKNSVKIYNQKFVTFQQYFDGETPVIDLQDSELFNNKTDSQAIIKTPKGLKRLEIYSKKEDSEIYSKYIKEFTVEHFTNKQMDLHLKEIESNSKNSSFEKPIKEEYKTLKKFIEFIRSPVIIHYLQYINGLKISIILSFLLLIIFYAVPNYSITGSGDERAAKIRFLGFDMENEEESIQYLVKSITGNFITKNRDTSYIKWQILQTRYKDIKTNISKYNEFLARHFNIVYQEIKELPDIKQKLEIKHDDIITKSLFLENIHKQEYLWNQFRPRLNITYEDSITLGSASALLYEYNSLEKTISQLESKQTDEYLEIIRKISIIKNNLFDISRKLGSKIIIKINNLIHQEKQALNLSKQTVSYISTCCITALNNNYTKYFSEKSSEFNDMLQINNEIENKIKFNDQSNTLAIKFNQYKNNRDETNTNKLLDYMYIKRELFNSEQDYLLYLKQSIINTNNIIITELLSDRNINQPRIWQKQVDTDIYLIDDILNEYTLKSSDEKITQEYIRTALERKLTDIYNIEEDYLQSKIYNLINNKGVIEIDLITNHTKYHIKTEIEKFFIGKSLDDIIQYIKQSNLLIQNNRIVLKSDFAQTLPNYNYNHDNNLYYKKELQQIFKINEIIQNMPNTTSVIPFYSDLKVLVDENRITDTELIRIYNTHFKFKSDQLELLVNAMEQISQSINREKHLNLITKKSELRKFLNNIGNYQNIYDEMVINLKEQLIIENYHGQNYTDEFNFREKLLVNNKLAKNIQQINHYSYSILNILSIICNKYKSKIKYEDTIDILHKEVFNKKLKNTASNANSKYIPTTRPWWLNYNYPIQEKKCLCPYPNNSFSNFITNYSSYYDDIDDTIINLVSKDIDTVEDTLGLIQNFITDSNNLYDLFDIMNSNKKNNFKNISILDYKYLLTISKFIFYSTCTFAFETLSNFSLIGTELSKSVYEFIFSNNIIYNELIKDTNDINIINKINIYKSNQNINRKTRSDKMSNEERSVQQLYRKFNLGNIYGSLDEINASETINITDLEVDNDLSDKNIYSKFSSEEEISNTIEQTAITMDEDESGIGKGMAEENDGNRDDDEDY